MFARIVLQYERLPVPRVLAEWEKISEAERHPGKDRRGRNGVVFSEFARPEPMG